MTTTIIFWPTPTRGIYKADHRAWKTLDDHDLLPKPGDDAYEAEYVHGEHIQDTILTVSQKLADKTGGNVIAETYERANGELRITASFYVYPTTEQEPKITHRCSHAEFTAIGSTVPICHLCDEVVPV